MDKWPFIDAVFRRWKRKPAKSVKVGNLKWNFPKIQS